MWMSISGTTLCLFVRFPTTADLIKEQTFVITCDARGRTSSFPVLLCGEEERFRFSPERTCWFRSLPGPLRCREYFRPRSVLRPRFPNPWSLVKHRPATSRSSSCCYAADCFPDVVGIYPRKIGSTTSGVLGFRESAFHRHG
jgi:hypothetical protein